MSKTKLFQYNFLNFLCTFLPDFLGGEKIFHVGGHLYLTLLKVVVKWVTVICALGDYASKRNAEHLYHLSEGVGKGNRTAVKGIACLGEHYH